MRLIASTQLVVIGSMLDLSDVGKRIAASEQGVSNHLGSELRREAWAARILDYVLHRQNEDGGYAFAQGLESNAQDTFYGLAILRLLNAGSPRIEHTLRWLRSLPTRDLYALYYVSKALWICGEPNNGGLRDRVLAFRRADGSFGTTDVDIEATSELISTFMATELICRLGHSENMEATVNWLRGRQNGDGGFGAGHRSNLRSTFHALASLNNLGYPVESMRGAVGFIRSCELPGGGFSVVPGISISYLEDIYYGLSALEMAGERSSYPENTTALVYSCQNSNGGFRRSPDLGISTFEDTYFALMILRELGRV